ncbi:MAG: hypothetical protein ACJ71C_00345 [Nitrososphaeraceae archaeon]
MTRTFMNNLLIHVSSVITRPIVNSVAILFHRYPTFLSLSIGMLLCSSLLVSYPSVLAQTNGGVATQNQGAQGGILEKISDKGNYRVQILWNQLTILGGSAIPSPGIPKQGFEMEIDFLNASAPLPTAKTVPQKETGIRSESPVGGSVNQIPTPSIIQTTVPIDSYDITIYTDHGQELWKKLNQPVTGGRGVQRVIFENSDYSGGITIQITNIKSGDIPPNAVTFTARIS